MHYIDWIVYNMALAINFTFVYLLDSINTLNSFWNAVHYEEYENCTSTKIKIIFVYIIVHSATSGSLIFLHSRCLNFQALKVSLKLENLNTPLDLYRWPCNDIKSIEIEIILVTLFPLIVSVRNHSL